MIDLNMQENGDPFEYIAKIKTIQDGVAHLKIDVNLVLQYFFLNGMTERFRNNLISITNNAKPTLDDINKYFFEVCERVKNFADHEKKKKVSTTGLSVNVKPVAGNFHPESRKNLLLVAYAKKLILHSNVPHF